MSLGGLPFVLLFMDSFVLFIFFVILYQSGLENHVCLLAKLQKINNENPR